MDIMTGTKKRVFNDSFQDFKKAWKQSYMLVGQMPPSDDIIRTAYEMFMDYPQDIVLEAIYQHTTTSEFPVKPANVFNFIKSKMGVSPEEIRNEAYLFFDKYLLNLNANDAVIANWKYAIAFRCCFRSIEDYLNRPNSEYSVNRDRELFAKCVMNHHLDKVDLKEVQYVFKGKRTFKSTIRVNFFDDDYAKCKALAQAHYAITGEDQQYYIEYPIEPSKQIEYKKDAPTELTEEQKKQSLDFLNQLIGILS